MPVQYNSNKIIPAPFVTYNRTQNRTQDHDQLGNVWQITVRGKILAEKGSPNSSGTFHTVGGYPSDEDLATNLWLKSLLKKQEALQNLFSEDGKSFEVQPLDGSAPTKCNPRIISVEFSEGNWTNFADYTIVMEADAMYLSGEVIGGDLPTENNPPVSEFSEEWSIEAGDENNVTFRLTRNLQATGKRFFDETGTLLNNKEPWENAKDYIINKIKLGIKAERMEAPDVLSATSLQAYNYARTQNLNEKTGLFAVTETWLCYDPGSENAAISDYTVDTRVGPDGISRVTVNGSITGLEVRNNTTYALISSRYTNAKLKWDNDVAPNLHTIAQNLSGVNLNASEVNTQVGRNQTSGIITFNYEYDSRPNTSITNAKTQNVTITNSGGADVFAQVPVLGRAIGPVLQDIATKTAKKRTIAIEAQLKASTQDFALTEPDTDSIVLTYTPSNIVTFVEEDTITFSPDNGRYSRNTVFVWQ